MAVTTAHGAFVAVSAASFPMSIICMSRPKASLARTVSAGKVEYSGPLTLRHVGLCSANGVEEKSGELRLAVSRWTGGVEGTLAMDGDNCRLVASPSRPYSGLLSCRNAQGVPINFSIEQASGADARSIRK
jgi:hypothetical protein